MEKNCPLVIIYSIATLGSAVDSYLTDHWLSVLLSLCTAVVTFFLGYSMLREVITITKEILPEGGAAPISEPPSGDDPKACPCLPPGICELLRKTLSAIVMWLSGA